MNGVRWFQVVGSKSVVWTAIRPGPSGSGSIYVELTVPTSYAAQDGFLVDLANPLKIALP